MNYNTRKVSKLAGFLIILGIIAGALSIVPSVESETFLEDAFPDANGVLIGAVFQFMLVPIYIGFALVLYPVLRDNHKSLAVGFVGFRFMAGVFQIFGLLLLPLFIFSSEQYLGDTDANSQYYQTTGEMLKLIRDLTNHLGVMLATGLGNLMLYCIFLKEKHIPKWLSIWGVIGNTLVVLAGFFLLFGVIEVVSIEYGIVTMPLVIQEIVLAAWLMVKGLNSDKMMDKSTLLAIN